MSPSIGSRSVKTSGQPDRTSAHSTGLSSRKIKLSSPRLSSCASARIFCDLGCQLIRQETRCSRFRTMSGRRSKTSSTSGSSFLLHRQSRNPWPASSTMNRCKAIQAGGIVIPATPSSPTTPFHRVLSQSRTTTLCGGLMRDVDFPGQDRPERGEEQGRVGDVPELVPSAGRGSPRPDTDRSRRAGAGTARGLDPARRRSAPRPGRTGHRMSRSPRTAGESGQRPTINGAVERAAAASRRVDQVGRVPRQDSSRSSVPCRPGPGPHPVFEPDQHHVDALAIPRQQAARVEQLLEDLVVRRELDRSGEV